MIRGTSFIWEAITIGGEPHREYKAPENEWIGEAAVLKRFKWTAEDLEVAQSIGFPQGRRGLGVGNGAPRPETQFRTRHIDEWLEKVRGLRLPLK